MARHFRPPGRLMFLRPVKTSCQEPAARRAFEAVWIDAEVRIHQCTLALRCRVTWQSTQRLNCVGQGFQCDTCCFAQKGNWLYCIANA